MVNGLGSGLEAPLTRLEDSPTSPRRSGARCLPGLLPTHPNRAARRGGRSPTSPRSCGARSAARRSRAGRVRGLAYDTPRAGVPAVHRGVLGVSGGSRSPLAGVFAADESAAGVAPARTVLPPGAMLPLVRA